MIFRGFAGIDLSHHPDMYSSSDIVFPKIHSMDKINFSAVHVKLTNVTTKQPIHRRICLGHKVVCGSETFCAPLRRFSLVAGESIIQN